MHTRRTPTASAIAVILSRSNCLTLFAAFFHRCTPTVTQAKLSDASYLIITLILNQLTAHPILSSVTYTSGYPIQPSSNCTELLTTNHSWFSLLLMLFNRKTYFYFSFLISPISVTLWIFSHYYPSYFPGPKWVYYFRTRLYSSGFLRPIFQPIPVLLTCPKLSNSHKSQYQGCVPLASPFTSCFSILLFTYLYSLSNAPYPNWNTPKTAFSSIVSDCLDTSRAPPRLFKWPTLQIVLKQINDVNEHHSPVTVYGPVCKSALRQRPHNVISKGNVPWAAKSSWKSAWTDCC